MTKRTMRAMTVGELRHFLGRFDPDAPLRLMRLDDYAGGSADLHSTAGQAIAAMADREESDRVTLSSPGGPIGVWGFLSTAQPTLIASMTTASIRHN